jgi:hypothetical protein
MRTNKLHILVAVVCIIITTSCAKEETQNYAEISNNSNESEYLDFTSQTEFDDVIQSYIAFENGSFTETKSINRKTAKGFTSIAELQQSCLTKSGADDEEMTQDEFNIMKAKLLLPDPVLCYVLDTTLRIVVGNEFYKITPHGTFATHKGNEEELYAAIENFEQIKQNLNITESDSIVDITPSVKFINTFRDTPIRNNIVSEAEEYDDNLIAVADEEDVMTKAAGATRYYTSYGTINSYKWASKTLLGKCLDKLLGTSAKRDISLPSNAQMTFEVFSVNYVFYASSGFKVKVEKQKKWWFVKYWVDEAADKMVVGFDELTGKMKFDLPQPPVKTQTDAINAFSGYLNGVVKKFCFKGYNSLGFMKDFASDVYSFIPDLNLPVGATTQQKINTAIQTQAKDFINNVTPKTVYNCLTDFTGKYISSIKKYIEAQSPRALYVLGAPTELSVFTNGVKNYGRASSKTIRFDQSFGFTASFLNGNLSASAYLPSRFEIKQLDIFAAVYYGGQWKGIRFYTE